MKLRFLLLAALLPACSTPPLTSTLAEPVVAAPLAVLAAGEVPDWSNKLRGQLADALEDTAGAAVEARTGGLIVRLPAEQAFAPASAQLKPGALAPCAAIAGAYREHAGAVIHVLAYSAADSDLEPALRLAARRAASLQQELSLSGISPARLRAEGRELAAGAPERIELVFQPVVLGQEAQAWMPPAESK